MTFDIYCERISILKYMYVHLSALDLNESSDFFHVLALHSESDGDRWALFIGVG